MLEITKITLSTMSKKHDQSVTAIITAMTDSERYFVSDTLKSVLSQPEILQAIVCVNLENTWIDNIDGVEDSRVKILRMPMAYLGSVRNTALDYVTNDWVAYCDGDDIWCNGKIKHQLDIAIKSDSDFVGCDHYLINESGKVRTFSKSREVALPSSWLVKTEVMHKYPFDGSLPSSEDGVWWRSASPNISMVRLPLPLLKYRVRKSSLSSGSFSKRRKTFVISLCEFPILREFIFIGSWLMWMFYRSKAYI